MSLKYYRLLVDQQPTCDDHYLAYWLGRARSGDDEARRRILGSYLRLALRCVETQARTDAGLDVLDLVQEANAALNEGLAAFKGDTALDLEQCLRLFVQQRLASLGMKQGTSEA